MTRALLGIGAAACPRPLAHSNGDASRRLDTRDLVGAGFTWNESEAVWELRFADADAFDARLCWYLERVTIGENGAAVRCRTVAELRRLFDVLDLALAGPAGVAS
jgi:hypothetical protein